MYFKIKFVEFLDFICRVAIDYFDITPDRTHDLHDKVHEIIKLFWPKPKGEKVKETTKRREKAREKKENRFPLLEEPVFEDSDEY
jgi:hypothetical protein